ncbi:MAG: ABC transporter permease [Syntrophobacteraceae bacterium]|jgi:ribose transport system permease protein
MDIAVSKKKGVDFTNSFIFLGRHGTILILIAMALTFSICLPSFRTTDNFLNLLGQTAILSIFAVGLTCCLKVGDFDLSIGGIAALTGVVVAKMLALGYCISFSIMCGLLTGLAIGLMNGVLVAYVGLSAFVCTLATMSVVLGIAQGITQGSSIWSGIPKSFGVLGRGYLAHIPIRFMIAFGLLLIIWFIHAYTKTGRRMEAIGGNSDAARLCGISVERNRLLAFMISGFCSAIAGIVLASSLMSANPVQGTLYLLDAFGACFIGAATIRIGQFHIWGTFVGVIIVVVAINGLIILMVPGYLMDMIKGIILLSAVTLSGLVGRIIKQ